jgi:hypothetical protein
MNSNMLYWARVKLLCSGVIGSVFLDGLYGEYASRLFIVSGCAQRCVNVMRYGEKSNNPCFEGVFTGGILALRWSIRGRSYNWLTNGAILQ